MRTPRKLLSTVLLGLFTTGVGAAPADRAVDDMKAFEKRTDRVAKPQRSAVRTVIEPGEPYVEIEKDKIRHGRHHPGDKLKRKQGEDPGNKE